MADIMTYDSLASEIVGWAQRYSDLKLAQSVPAIIFDAETMLARELAPLGFTEAFVTTFTPNNPVVQKPNRWRSTISVTMLYSPPVLTPDGYAPGPDPPTRTRVLWPRSLEFCRSAWPQESASSPDFLPTYYADYDWNNLYLAPTPDRDYPVSILARCRPPPLDIQSQQNWVTLNAPDLLRSACMARASFYLKNMQMAQMWREDYTRAINSLTVEDRRRVSDRSTTGGRVALPAPAGPPGG